MKKITKNHLKLLKNIVVIISGTSGAGKSTLINKLLNEYD